MVKLILFTDTEKIGFKIYCSSDSPWGLNLGRQKIKNKTINHSSQCHLSVEYNSTISFVLFPNLWLAKLFPLSEVTGHITTWQILEVLFLDLYSPGLGSSPLITIIGQKDGEIELMCSSEGWFPKPHVQWKDMEAKIIPSFSEVLTQGSHGLFHVKTSLLVTNSFIVNVTCSISNPLLGEEKMATFSLSGWWLHVFLSTVENKYEDKCRLTYFIALPYFNFYFILSDKISTISCKTGLQDTWRSYQYPLTKVLRLYCCVYTNF